MEYARCECIWPSICFQSCHIWDAKEICHNLRIIKLGSLELGNTGGVFYPCFVGQRTMTH